MIGKPDALQHSIVISPHGEQDSVVPLSLHGVTSFFATRKPTLQEYEQAVIYGRSFDLTYDSPEWDPHSDTFSSQEMVAQESLNIEHYNKHSVLCELSVSMLEAYVVYERGSQCSSILSEISPSLCDDMFISMLESNVLLAPTSEGPL